MKNLMSKKTRNTTFRKNSTVQREFSKKQNKKQNSFIVVCMTHSHVDTKGCSKWYYTTSPILT